MQIITIGCFVIGIGAMIIGALGNLSDRIAGIVFGGGFVLVIIAAGMWYFVLR